METKFEPQSMVYFFLIKFNYILYYYALMSLYFQLLEKKKKNHSRRKSVLHEGPFLFLSLKDYHTNFDSFNKPPKNLQGELSFSSLWSLPIASNDLFYTI